MGGRSVPGGPGWRIHPCGRDAPRTIPDLGDCEPGEPCSDEERRNRRDAPTVRRDVTRGAVLVAQCLARRGELGIAAVAMVVLGVGGGSDKRRRRAWEIQAVAMAREHKLGPEQRRHREEDGAPEPIPMADADHDVSLPLTGTDAIDPSQSLAKPKGGSGGDLAGLSALATTDTELRLIASAATIGAIKRQRRGWKSARVSRHCHLLEQEAQQDREGDP